jgi:trigger factor
MTLDPSTLRIELDEHERWRRTLRISVPAEVVEREQEKALRSYAARIKVPGFRKGKAPLSAIERHAPAVLRDTLERIADEAYRLALRERSLEPISEGDVAGVDFRPEGGLSFSVSFDVAPVLALTRLEGFEVERPRAAVEDSDVEAVLRRLLAENAIWRPAEDDGSPREGDLVTVEIERLDGGGGEGASGERTPTAGASSVTDRPHAGAAAARREEPARAPLPDLGLPWLRRLRLRADTRLGKRFQLVLGEGDALPELEAAIRSLAPGQARDVVIPGDPSWGPGASPLHLRLALVDRRMRELPELDDVFARSLGELEGVDALRQRVRADLEEEARDAAEKLLRERLLDAAIAANPFEVPASLVARRIDAALGDTRGADPEVVARARAELAEGAEAAVKRTLIAQRIAEQEGLGATPQEVEERLAGLAALGGVAPEQVRARLVQSKRLDALVRDVTERKVVAFLAGRSGIR